MIHTGDCIEVMAGMPADSVDAVVTDPPYGLEFMGKRWDAFKSPGRGARVSKERAAELTPTGKGHTTSKGPFLAAGVDQYIAGSPFQAWCEAWGREALRVTKPGGYLLAFGGTRTHHRLVCGLEDAGWIIRDELDWIYASGFPKGRANLKPAHEPIVLARKPGPLRPLAIDECRIPGAEDGSRNRPPSRLGSETTYAQDEWTRTAIVERNDTTGLGRWPSNLLLSDPELFDEPNPYVVGSGATAGSVVGFEQEANIDGKVRAGGDGGGVTLGIAGPKNAPSSYGDSGGYSRFFIVPKADRADREPIERWPIHRNGMVCGGGECTEIDEATDSHPTDYLDGRRNTHPTVKPTDLMRHLVRLVTPSGGTVLDPFAGSGSTILACELEGFAWIAIEKEAEYVRIMEARLNGTQRGFGFGSEGVG